VTHFQNGARSFRARKERRARDLPALTCSGYVLVASPILGYALSPSVRRRGARQVFIGKPLGYRLVAQQEINYTILSHESQVLTAT